jgi:hypothetical protein
MDFKAISTRICTLRIKGKFFNYTIINVHEPMEVSAEEEKESPVMYCILFQFHKSNTLSVITLEDIELVMLYNYTIFYPQMKILITTE